MRRARAAVVLATALLLLEACFLSQAPIPSPNDEIALQVTRDALQYRSPLPRDLAGAHAHLSGREVRGEACQTKVSFPPVYDDPFLGSEAVLSQIPWDSANVAFGNSGYRKALARAKETAGNAALFDVRADTHTTSVLGIWTRQCTEVVASVAQ
jgi:hypothetical protein